MSIRNKGIKLIYSENDFRQLIRKIIVNKNATAINIVDNIKYFLPNLDVRKIIDIIKEVEEEWCIKLTDYTFYSIVVYTSLAIYRDKVGYELNINEREFDLISKFSEYKFAQSIYNKINKKFNRKLDINEVKFLALQILCNTLVERNSVLEPENYIVNYDKKLRFITKEVIKTVGEILGVNFLNDSKLFDGLLMHFTSMIFRLKYSQSKKNKFINVIKQDYLNVFRAVWSTSFLFEEYYDVQITEDCVLQAKSLEDCNEKFRTLPAHICIDIID